MTAGLYPYEIVLLVLGVILFLVLIFAFLYLVLHGKKIASLLAFFLLPIAMIGYPSLHSIQYKDGVLTLEKSTKELLANPEDASTRSKVEDKVSELSQRPVNNPADATVVAKAQFAVGDESSAQQTLQKVFTMAPEYPEAVQLRNKIQLVHRLADLADKVDQNPSDEAAKSELQQTVVAAKRIPFSNPVALAHLAHAESALGDHQSALTTIKRAEVIKPEVAVTQQVKQSILSHAATAPAK